MFTRSETSNALRYATTLGRPKYGRNCACAVRNHPVRRRTDSKFAWTSSWSFGFYSRQLKALQKKNYSLICRGLLSPRRQLLLLLACFWFLEVRDNAAYLYDAMCVTMKIQSLNKDTTADQTHSQIDDIEFPGVYSL